MTAHDVIMSHIANTWGGNGAGDQADAILAALAAAGFKVLAREPTEAVIAAADAADPDGGSTEYADLFRAMWDAATPGAQP